MLPNKVGRQFLEKERHFNIHIAYRIKILASPRDGSMCFQKDLNELTMGTLIAHSFWKLQRLIMACHAKLCCANF